MNIKHKFDFGEVLWATHNHIIFTKLLLEITEGIKYTITIKLVLLKNEEV